MLNLKKCINAKKVLYKQNNIQVLPTLSSPRRDTLNVCCMQFVTQSVCTRIAKVCLFDDRHVCYRITKWARIFAINLHRSATTVQRSPIEAQPKSASRRISAYSDAYRSNAFNSFHCGSFSIAGNCSIIRAANTSNCA